MITPIDLQRWIAEHRHLLKPPVGNKVVWKDSEFICMVVGGPNQRTDYHYDEGPEFFMMIEGDMLLKVHENGALRDIPIREGEIFLLPPRVPHSPQRFEGTVGLVIERQRRAGESDGLMWFCEQCAEKLYEEYFELVDIETQFTPVFERFYRDTALRTCQNCKHLNPAPERFL
jgi:3-hydroxyanthranilate 3,4-dioxygenase